MPTEHPIHVERVYPQPPEIIWRAITEADAIAQWMAPTTFRPVVGHHFDIQPPEGSNNAGVFDAEVTLVDEPRQLAYQVTSNAMKHPTTVTWTLTPQDGDTLLSVDHTGFSGIFESIVANLFDYAWQQLLIRLKSTVDELARQAPNR